MKNIHLVCGAHIDPVWLWQKPAGIAEAISTFRVAADFIEEYDGFVFCHNEALLYEWVETHEPTLFERIQKLVAEGKWHIMGGWYLQPDVLLPTGESILRQIEIGKKYFMEKFSVNPTTALNFDSFGHSRGLVQILKKCGYDSYLFVRPFDIIKERDFIWKGYDGSEIIGHNIVGGYGTNKGEALTKLKGLVENPPYQSDDVLMLWGIGNHGGGPSRVDLESINKYRAEHPEINFIHSTPERYFEAVDRTGLKTYDVSMQHCMVGCYTTMTKIKHLHRKLENELDVCEKMLQLSGIAYDEQQMLRAVKALLFSEFHDSLPGTMIEKAEEDTAGELEFGRQIVRENTTAAFFELCKGQKKCKDGEIPVMVFNPHPYELETDVEFEFVLENQNRTDGEVTLAHVYDENGRFLPTQNEKPDCSLSMDWVKHVVFHAKLAPMSMNRFDCELEVTSIKRRPDFDTYYFKNDNMEVSINKATGFIDCYKVNGVNLVDDMRIVAYKDNEDPWGMLVDSFPDIAGKFELMSVEEVNSFNGYSDKAYENVRLIETGDVRTKIQAVFKFNNSFAVVTYTIPKLGAYVDVNIDMYANDANIMYKLEFDTPFKDGQFIGQAMFGRENLLTDGREVCYQKWCAYTDKDNKLGMGILNRGTYGGSAKDGRVSISMMRTPIYSAHPIEERPLTESDRNHSHIDMGRRCFDYRLVGDISGIDAEAEIYNSQPIAMSFFPSGEGVRKDTVITIDNREVLMTKYNNNIMHLFNASETEQEATVTVSGVSHSVSFGPFEIKSFRVDEDKLSECGLIDF